MKKLTVLVVAIVTCLSLTGCGEKLKLEDANRKLKNAYDTIEDLEEEAEEFETEKYEYLAQIDSLEDDVRDLNAEIDRLTAELEECQGQEATIITVEDTNEYYENLINDLNTQVKSLQDQISQLTSANGKGQYSTGNVSSNQYAALQNEINVLRNELQNYKTVAATLQQQLNDQIALNKKLQNSSSNSSYLSIKFWSDGYTYYANNVTWYSDANCISRISDQDSIVITSPIVSKDELSNGYIVYTCMSNYGLIYSPYKPSLRETE